MYHLDAVVTHWINGLSGQIGAVDTLMVWVTTLGVPLMVLATAGQWWVRHDRMHVRHVLVAAGLSFLLGLAINQLILLFVHRLRPYDAGLTHLLIPPNPTDFSFPSDHATATIAIAAAFLLHGMKQRGLAFLAAAVLVMFSRVFVGTHYVSDVLGGAATALFAAWLVRVGYREGTGLDRLVTRIL